MVVGKLAAQTPSRFNVFSSMLEATTRGGQHAKQAIYRAIENRRPVIRCTNTGISTVISPSGNITHNLSLNKSGVIRAKISPQNNETFYTKYGDIFVHLNGFISILFFIGALIKKR